MNDIEAFCPKDKNDWRQWLEVNHESQDAIWLIFYRKKSPKFNLTWSESVDEALCFGWIDSTKRTIDNESYKQYFSKRKAKSNWSKINKDKVKTLIKHNRMQEAGYNSIEIAKENGSWSILDEIEALIIPEDLKHELENSKGALTYFDNISKSMKKILLHWVISAKRKETREKRILEIVENARNQRIPKQFL